MGTALALMALLFATEEVGFSEEVSGAEEIHERYFEAAALNLKPQGFRGFRV